VCNRAFVLRTGHLPEVAMGGLAGGGALCAGAVHRAAGSRHHRQPHHHRRRRCDAEVAEARRSVLSDCAAPRPASSSHGHDDTGAASASSFRDTASTKQQKRLGWFKLLRPAAGAGFGYLAYKRPKLAIAAAGLVGFTTLPYVSKAFAVPRCKVCISGCIHLCTSNNYFLACRRWQPWCTQ